MLLAMAVSETTAASQKMLAVRIDKRLHSRLKELASDERRTMAAQTEIALEEHFEKHGSAA